MTDPRTGAEMVVRSHQLKAKVNPIPKALRGMLGSDEFKVVVQAQWYRLRYSFEDAMSLTVRPPVMPDRIKIRGWQWAERVDDHNCNLCTKMEISVKIPAPGVGGQVEKGTANGMKGAYADQPRRVVTYLATRKAAGRPYDDPFVWEAERLAKEAKAKAESAMVAAPSMAMAAAPSTAAVAETPAQPPPFSSPLTLQPPRQPTPSTTGQPLPASRPPPSTAASTTYSPAVNTPAGGNPSLTTLREQIANQKAAMREAEAELAEMVAAEEARLNGLLASTQKELETARAELHSERAHSASLQQKLEDARADLREEKLRSQELGNALATALRQLKSGDDGALAGPPMVAAISGQGNGGANAAAARARAANAQARQAAAMPPPSRLSQVGGGGGPLPPDGWAQAQAERNQSSRLSIATAPLQREETELMGDVFDDEDGEEEEHHTTGNGGAYKKNGTSSGAAPAPAPAAPPPPVLEKAHSLQGILRVVAGGEHVGDTMRDHVGLGGNMLTATNRRLLYLKKGTWELYWQVPLKSVVRVDQVPNSSVVELLVTNSSDVPGPNDGGTSVRRVECMTQAVVPLVVDTVKRAMA